MKDIIRAFRRIPERNRTIAYGFLSLLLNLFYFTFKIVVGIIFNTPLLIAIAIYDLIIGFVKANCSRALWKHKDNLEDCKTYIFGGAVLLISSIIFIIYITNQVDHPYKIQYNIVVAILIAGFAAYRMIGSVIGLCKTKGRTMLIKEYRVANFASALNNLVLTQMALLALMTIPNMHLYNSIIALIVATLISLIGMYLVIHGLVQLRVYTTGITNKKHKKNNQE